MSTFTTHQAVVNREDLSDVIYRISPTDTPFLSAIGRSKATNTLHEWTTDELATPAKNATIEGAPTATDSVNPGVRCTNRVQYSRKAPSISTTQQAAKSAGNLYRMATQMAKKSAELKLDIEYSLLNNKTAVDGNGSTTASELRGLDGWIATNVNLGAGGAAPDPYNNVAAVDGTPRDFTEDLLIDVLQKCYQEGGKPNLILLAPPQKQKFSTFGGRANTTVTDAASAKTLINAVDIYVSDYGRLKVVPSRIVDTSTAYVLETEKFSTAYLQPFQQKDLAYQGGAISKEITVQYTLRVGNEKSSGVIRDLDV